MRCDIKTLSLDIETAPNTAHVWGLWQQNVGIPQLRESSYVLCWAAKWINEDKVMFSSVQRTKPEVMLQKIHGLLEEADAVVHYNGTKFDIPTLNKEFLLHGMEPPSPYKQIDLLRVVKSQFRFPSNKLDYVAQRLDLGGKTKHAGHEMWIQCMANVPSAWRMMKEYNMQDVALLESLYYKLLPWIKNHPNHSEHSGKRVCTRCGHDEWHHRGWSAKAGGMYRRYSCKKCGGPFQERKPEKKHGVSTFVNIP